MKKMAAWMLAICLVFSFFACNDNSNKASRKNASSDTKSSTSKTEQGEASDDSDDTESKELSSMHGNIDGDLYTNAYFGLTVKRPKGWIFCDQEQIAEVNHLTAEVFEGSVAEEFLKKSGGVDMILLDGGKNNINVLIQKEDRVSHGLSDEQVYQLSEELFKEQYATAGMEVQTYEQQTMQVGGAECTVLHVISMTEGEEMKQYQLRVKGAEYYTAIITLTLFEGGDLQAMLDALQIQNP